MKKLVKIIIALVAAAIGIGIGVIIYHKANIQEFVDRKRHESDEKDVVATISGKSLTKKECVAYLAALKSYTESIYSDQVWDYEVDNEGTTYEEMLKESLLEKIIYIKLVCAKAPEYGISMTNEDKVEVNEYVQKFFSQISEDTANEYELTTELITKIYTENFLASKVYKKLTLNHDPDLKESDCRQGVFYRMQFDKCYEDNNGNRVFYDEETLKNLDNKVNVAYQDAQNGDFLTVAENNISNQVFEVTLGTDKLPAQIASEVMSMKDNSMSRILETSDAYYIFYCVSSYDKTATQKAYQEKLVELRDEYFKGLYAAWYDDSKKDVNREVWETIELVGDK